MWKKDQIAFATEESLYLNDSKLYLLPQNRQTAMSTAQKPIAQFLALFFRRWSHHLIFAATRSTGRVRRLVQPM